MDNQSIKSFIKFPRMDAWTLWDAPNATHLFLYLLTHANIEAKQWHGITIERGQIVCSIRHLGKETGMTYQNVRSALNKLILTHFLTQQVTHPYTIITICNYDIYNGTKNSTNALSNALSNTNNRKDIERIESKEIYQRKDDDDNLSFLDDLDLSGIPAERVKTWFSNILAMYPCKGNMKAYFDKIWASRKSECIDAYNRECANSEAQSAQSTMMQKREQWKRTASTHEQMSTERKKWCMALINADYDLLSPELKAKVDEHFSKWSYANETKMFAVKEQTEREMMQMKSDIEVYLLTQEFLHK